MDALFHVRWDLTETKQGWIFYIVEPLNQNSSIAVNHYVLSRQSLQVTTTNGSSPPVYMDDRLI